MEFIFELAGLVVSLIDYLYILFVVPIGQIPVVVLELASDSFNSPLYPVFLEFVSFLSAGLTRYCPWILGVSLGPLLVGSGLVLVLLWRFLKFLFPILDAL